MKQSGPPAVRARQGDIPPEGLESPFLNPILVPHFSQSDPPSRPHTASSMSGHLSPDLARQNRAGGYDYIAPASSPNHSARYDPHPRPKGILRQGSRTYGPADGSAHERSSSSSERARQDGPQTRFELPSRSPSSGPWSAGKLLASPLIAIKGQRVKSGGEDRTPDGLKPATQRLKTNPEANLRTAMPGLMVDEMFGHVLPKPGLAKPKDTAPNGKASTASTGRASPSTQVNGASKSTKKSGYATESDSSPDGASSGIKAKKTGRFFARASRESPKGDINGGLRQRQTSKGKARSTEVGRRLDDLPRWSADESDEDQTPPATPGFARQDKAQVNEDDDDPDKWSICIIAPDRNPPSDQEPPEIPAQPPRKDVVATPTPGNRPDVGAAPEQVIADGPRPALGKGQWVTDPYHAYYPESLGDGRKTSGDGGSLWSEAWTSEAQESALDDTSQVDVCLSERPSINERAPEAPLRKLEESNGRSLHSFERPRWATPSLSTITSGDEASTADREADGESVLTVDGIDLQQALKAATRTRGAWDGAGAAAQW